MTARTWTASDPAPKDWPVVVGPDGMTYGQDHDAADSEDISGLYTAQQITHLQSGGATFGPVGMEFAEIFDLYEDGAALREATDEEARTWVERWPSESGGVW
jgi:hypothetical protein